MSNIPRAREIITEAAAMLPVGNASRALLMVALPMLVRERPVRRAPATKKPMTSDMKRRIITYAKHHPQAQVADIAVLFGVNQGRVSEVLTGKR